MTDEQLNQLRRRLHSIPELGYHEHKTADFIATFFAELGIETTRSIAKTGLAAVIKGELPGPTLCYRADMDALPIREATGQPWQSQHDGCMHACGHDAHMAIALAIADTLNAQRDRLRGSVVFLFQPNEEGDPAAGPSGGQAVADANFLDDFAIDACVALHVDPTREVGVMATRAEAMWAASSRFDIVVRGRGGHAAHPEKTRDPLEAAARLVTSTYSRLARRRDGRNREMLSFTMLHAGANFNVITSAAELTGIIRAESAAKIREIDAILVESLEALTREGFGYQHELHLGAPAVVNAPRLALLALEALQKTEGIEAETCQMQMASEDFAYLSERRPSVFCLLGTRGDEATSYPVHNARFDIDERALSVGVTGMVAILSHIAEHWHE